MAKSSSRAGGGQSEGPASVEVDVAAICRELHALVTPRTPPPRESGTFLTAEYAEEAGISITKALREIAGLRERGLIEPCKIMLRRASGGLYPTPGYRYVRGPK